MRTRLYHIAGYLILGTLLFFAAPAALADDAAAPPYRIVERHSAIQIMPITRTLSIVDTITVHRLTSGHPPLILSLANLFEVRVVACKDKDVPFKRGDGTIRVDDIPSDSEFTITTWYSGDLVGPSEMSQIAADRTVLREESILPYTDESLRRAQITLIVPKEWYALTAGGLVGKEIHGDSAYYVWRSDVPLSNISWFCAGKYATTTYPGVVPVSVHLSPEDTVAVPERIGRITHAVLEYYSKTFGEYRFPKLDIVEVDNWVAGHNALAIASPSFVMVKHLAFETPDTFNQAATILPHEIAHQWWPLTAFIDENDGAVLAEGMCEYSARLFDESQGRLTPRDSLGKHPLLRPLILKAQQGTDIPLHQRADLRYVQTHYLKASYLHHMLRQVLGDTLFGRLYRDYCRKFTGTPATQRDFQNMAESLQGKNLHWFFDQWTEKTAIPKLKVYHAQTEKVGARWKTNGRVRILGYDKFTTFTDVGVRTARDTVYARVWLGSPLPGNRSDTVGAGPYANDMPFEVWTNSEPVEAVLDPQGNSLRISKIPAKLSDLRDPGKGLMIVGTRKHGDYLIGLAHKDSTIMALAGWELTIVPDSSVTLQGLQQQDVFLYGLPDENTVVASNASRFAYGVRNDSIIVGTSAVFDTSLTLIQAVDNPYFTNGLLCWIAPLTSKAAPQLMPYDASWIITRGTENISSGVWEVKDEDARTPVKPVKK